MKNNTKNGKVGRKMGSYSFSSIPLSELVGKLNPTSNVLVSTRFLSAMGITSGTTGEATTLLAKVNPSMPEVPASTVS